MIAEQSGLFVGTSGMRFALLLLLVYGLAGAQALTSLLEQHRADPMDWKLCNQIAIAYTEQQKFEEAAEFYRKVTVLTRPRDQL